MGRKLFVLSGADGTDGWFDSQNERGTTDKDLRRKPENKGPRTYVHDDD